MWSHTTLTQAHIVVSYDMLGISGPILALGPHRACKWFNNSWMHYSCIMHGSSFTSLATYFWFSSQFRWITNHLCRINKCAGYERNHFPCIFNLKINCLFSLHILSSNVFPVLWILYSVNQACHYALYRQNFKTLYFCHNWTLHYFIDHHIW